MLTTTFAIQITEKKIKQYTPEYTAEQLIWSIVDWENIVNRYDGHRCWTEPAEGAMGEHARLIQQLMEGFRIDVGIKKNFGIHTQKAHG